MMTYPFPLHRGGDVVWARVIIPDDLSEQEAERIGRMLQTLPLGEEETA
jgi:hypothetical protein